MADLEKLEFLPTQVSLRLAVVQKKENAWMACFRRFCCRRARSGGQNSKGVTLRTHRTGR